MKRSASDFQKRKKIKVHDSSQEGDSSTSQKTKNSDTSNEIDDSNTSHKTENSNTFNKTGNSNTSNKTENSQKEKNAIDAEDKKIPEPTNFSSVIAAHYNAVKTNFEIRNESRIVYLRNFNNWIKSILIKESVWKLPEHRRRNLKVLDLCCGKGGDLLKWSKLDVRYMVCSDIAENSLEQYKTRYETHIECNRKNGNFYAFECEFIPADCTRVRLRVKYRDPSIRFDFVSCQFSFHYCFESLPQAECMLKNASECLRPGGFFIGTLPNANEIVKRLKQSKSNIFKNDIFVIEMCCSEPYPLFGAKYHFYLEGVVNCPEFLVHFPTFKKLAMKYGLKLVEKENFVDCFERKKKTYEGEILLRKIKALELYPPEKNKTTVGPSKDYKYAKIYCEQNNVQRVGTLSQSEWEVVSLYQIFVFTKVEVT